MIICDYTCEACAIVFESAVPSPAPDDVECHECGGRATWTPSALVACRVRRVEVVRGGWQKPERPTYLDTRELGEGQSMDEFRAKRKAVWEERRKADVMAFKKGFG